MTTTERNFWEAQVRLLYALEDARVQREGWQRVIDSLRRRPLTRPETRAGPWQT